MSLRVNVCEGIFFIHIKPNQPAKHDSGNVEIKEGISLFSFLLLLVLSQFFFFYSPFQFAFHMRESLFYIFYISHSLLFNFFWWFSSQFFSIHFHQSNMLFLSTFSHFFHFTLELSLLCILFSAWRSGSMDYSFFSLILTYIISRLNLKFRFEMKQFSDSFSSSTESQQPTW